MGSNIINDIYRISDHTLVVTHLNEEILIRAYVNSNNKECLLWASESDIVGHKGKLLQNQSKLQTDHNGRYHSIRLKSEIVDQINDDFSQLHSVDSEVQQSVSSDSLIKQLISAEIDTSNLEEASFEVIETTASNTTQSQQNNVTNTSTESNVAHVPSFEADTSCSREGVSEEVSLSPTSRSEEIRVEHSVSSQDTSVKQGETESSKNQLADSQTSQESNTEADEDVDVDTNLNDDPREGTDSLVEAEDEDEPDLNKDEEEASELDIQNLHSNKDISNTDENIQEVELDESQRSTESIDTAQSISTSESIDDVNARRGVDDIEQIHTLVEFVSSQAFATHVNLNLPLFSRLFMSNYKSLDELESQRFVLPTQITQQKWLSDRTYNQSQSNEYIDLQSIISFETIKSQLLSPEAGDNTHNEKVEQIDYIIKNLLETVLSRYVENINKDNPVNKSMSNNSNHNNDTTADTEGESSIKSKEIDDEPFLENESQDSIKFDDNNPEEIEGSISKTNNDNSSELTDGIIDRIKSSLVVTEFDEGSDHAEDVNDDAQRTPDSLNDTDDQDIVDGESIESDQIDTDNEEVEFEDSDPGSELEPEDVQIDTKTDTDTDIDTEIEIQSEAFSASSSAYIEDNSTQRDNTDLEDNIGDTNNQDDLFYPRNPMSSNQSESGLLATVFGIFEQDVTDETTSHPTEDSHTILPEWFTQNLGRNTEYTPPAELTPAYPFEKTGILVYRYVSELRDNAAAGNITAERRLEDASRRFDRLKQKRPTIRGLKFSMFIVSTLFLYAAMILISKKLLDPGSLSYLFIITENRIADLLLVDIALIGSFVMASFIFKFIGQRTAPQIGYYAGEVARWAIVFVQLIPLIAMSVFLYRPVSERGTANQILNTYYQNVNALEQQVPEIVVQLGTYYYYEISPLGYSPLELTSWFLGTGIIFALPFAAQYWQAKTYATSLQSKELPKSRESQDSTDAEVDADDTEDFDITDVASWNESKVGTPTIESGTGYETAEQLLSIPDQMRLEPYEDYVEVLRYWINEPYTFISILRDDEQSDYRYFVMEPQLNSEEEHLLLEEFEERLETRLLFNTVEPSENETEVELKIDLLHEEVISLAEEYNVSVTEQTFHKLLYYLERNFVHYGPIQPLMEDVNIEDISCDGDSVPVFVFHQHYNDMMSNILFESKELRQFIIQLAQRSSEHISSARPIVDASLPTGDRINMTLGDEVTTRGSTFTIRIFQKTPFTPVHLIETNTFSIEQMAYIWQAIQYDKSLIFAGGTASGKTTSMNAVSLFIPPKSKVVTIEDTREISLPHINWIPGVTREGFGGIGDIDGAGSINMFDLVVSALRQRPEYMIVGEIRDEAAISLFQAMSTGHTTYSTMHADSVKRAISRLTNPPINVPQDMISALDIVCIQNQVRIQDAETGDIKNVRRNETTTEIVSVNPDIKTTTPFIRDAQLDEFRSNFDDSQVIDQIREEQGWTQKELFEDLEARQQTLEYLVDNDIKDVGDVTRTIQAYMLNPSRVTKDAKEGVLNPDDYKDITEIDLTKVTSSLKLGDSVLETMDSARRLPQDVIEETKQSW
ncbi:type II/IV secretion system ATPase subunit [Haloquadratum walsbyi]|uniref:Type II secretion system protein E n=1 Tax=Haloquadratum walsbyi J07HQW2 TaxID=1238425 RepID=U1PNX6_9EURY|nr:type II/IV secretion system ATPase subunit [Haloquadratum walsbyi]ERG93981.1 MAG: type II secretion system protein E [Haloquadratum walsbyi J07HQW2]